MLSQRCRNAFRLVYLRDAVLRDDVEVSISEQRLGMSRTSSLAIGVGISWGPTPFPGVGGRRSRGGVMISAHWLPRGGVTSRAVRLVLFRCGFGSEALEVGGTVS